MQMSRWQESVALIIMMGRALFINTSAASARWTYISDVKNVLAISSSGIADVTDYTRAVEGVTKVQAESVLQQYKGDKWITISPNWTATANSTYVSLNKTYAVESGYNT